MVAASRRPEIEPLRADRRHDMGGLADQRDAPRAESAAPCATASGNSAAAWLDLDLAEDRMRAPLDLGRQSGVVERGEVVGVGRIEHPDQARALPGQRHEREGAARRCGIQSTISWCWRECFKQTVSATWGYLRSSISMPAASRQSERRPSAPITRGARQGPAVLSVTVTAWSAGATSSTSSSTRRSAGKLARAGLQRRDQMAVLDVVAEGLEVDLAGLELDLRRAPEPAGVVDDAHDPQRRGLGSRRVPRRRGSPAR